ncbi:GDCCVxC domain-containing (seleno)protein [Paeniroseomonas aquatica]|uniref:GDCCVxC domain-containing (Seleno)protein n=1 Tax=Paeniroseomonas aquatica TaxID=373043 RepID=A0ABT8AFN3_9PROT|nr:GDCCVxC domain-containing (seleno)protein [Paeniroseomonas aquatica]MDN3568579.1 GDCCVxC domain-containing (seleno)protein [Paeniroseomonas aquatica]
MRGTTWPRSRLDAARLNPTITHPHCSHQHIETMPIDACQWFYDCRGCKAVL